MLSFQKVVGDARARRKAITDGKFCIIVLITFYWLIKMLLDTLLLFIWNNAILKSVAMTSRHVTLLRDSEHRESNQSEFS